MSHFYYSCNCGNVGRVYYSAGPDPQSYFCVQCGHTVPKENIYLEKNSETVGNKKTDRRSH